VNKRPTNPWQFSGMQNFLIISTAILLAFPVFGADSEPSSRSLTQLEKELFSIDAELENLAQFSLRTGMGTIGYRSQSHTDSHHIETIQIDLEPDSEFDEIVLVPTISRDTKTEFRADGFPIEFRVLAGDDHSTKTIASFSSEDQLLPRIAPLIISCPPTTATWIRLEVTTLSRRAFDGKYILELSEILVFDGHTNIALHRPVDASRNDSPSWSARQSEYLVDGFTPYLMDTAHGEQSIAFIGYDTPESSFSTITIDLGTPHALEGIHLHPVDLDDTIPQSAPPNFGIPRQLLVEGSTNPDFSYARPLANYQVDSAFDTGPIIMRRIQETTCRYVRLVSLDPFVHPRNVQRTPPFGFAEIELFSKGDNVALGKPVSSKVKSSTSSRSLSALTDGRNLYGQIIPIRNWLNELSRRHDLETRRPLVIAELNLRYAQQKTTLRLMYVLSALLLVGIGITMLIAHLLRTRGELLLKERIAADLHDELGANIHAIGLLSDLAADEKENPTQLEILHERIRTVTERTGIAIRHCTNMFEATELYKELKTDMERAARRILAKVKHDTIIEGEELIEELNSRTLFDLFLFYKECLTNISRHAEATYFATHLIVEQKRVQLVISDNGRGLPETDGQDIPSSLKRRAHLLSAKVVAVSTPNGGTRITLFFPIKRKHRRKK